MKNEQRIILTSHGLTTTIGRELIGKELSDDDLQEKRIFLFHEPHYSIEDMLIEACLNIGFKEKNVVLSGQQRSNDELLYMDYLYVTEGNTFEVMSIIRERGLDDVFPKTFKNGATYIGCSAGAMIGGTSIEEALNFDRNFLRMEDYRGLCLYDGIVIPHYTDAQLVEYIAKYPELQQKYNKILSVANDGILVIPQT